MSLKSFALAHSNTGRESLHEFTVAQQLAGLKAACEMQEQQARTMFSATMWVTHHQK